MPHTIPCKHFYMIRHGETVANAAKIMSGSTDTPLNDTGIAQAHAVQTVFEQLDIKPKVIIHSHLSRARDTARILNEQLNLPMHEEPDYGEMHGGNWEGAPYDVCAHLFRAWFDPPNGETVQAFFDRVRDAKRKTLTAHDTPLIVCHGGVFRAFWTLFDLTGHLAKNCQLYEFIPHERQDIFPWTVFRYEVGDDSTMNREAVKFT